MKPSPRLVRPAPSAVSSSFAERIRADFPFFERNVAGPSCVYLDNAATSLKPERVVSSMTRFYEEVSANVHRGRHLLSEVASRHFEESRSALAELIGVDIAEVVFTSGTTAAVNLVSESLKEPRPKVALSLLEHHSNVLPWMSRGEVVWFDPVKQPLDQTEELLKKEKVGLLAITACSNASGIMLPIKDYVEMCRRLSIKVLVDAAQLAAHGWWRLGSLGADYLVFSAHKMMGPFGLGVLAGRLEALEELEPRYLGGGTVEHVSMSDFRLRPVPARLEAGTPPIAEVIGMGKAAEYLRELSPAEVTAHEQALTTRLFERLRALKGLHILEDGWRGDRICLASIYSAGNMLSADQLSRMLFDRYQIASRSGHHCTHPYLQARNVPATTRLSAGPYTTLEEIDRACDAVEDLLRTFG